MKSYHEFIFEGKKGSRTEISGRVMTVNKSPEVSVNYSDDTLETLRKKLLKHYFEKSESNRNIINKCISTYVYTLDKKLRIGSDIIEKLAKAVGETTEKTQKTLIKITDDFYNEKENQYGVTS